MLVKFGGGILDASGSLGGNTFARNRYGNYVRSRVGPVNPNTSRQQYVRNLMGSLVEDWSVTLTQAQRDAWNVYANAIPWVNALGETVRLSGFNHFIRSNMAIIQAGGSLVADGPTTLTLPASDEEFVCTISEATQLISVAFDADRAWCDEDDAFMTVAMSIPNGAGREFLEQQLRYAGSIAGDSTTPPTSPQTIACPFPCAEDQKLYCQGRIIRADGRVSMPFLDTLTVAS